MIKIKRALISVSDKTNLIEFACKLQELNVEIISTGGTFKYLQQAGISVTEIASITNFPEILDGRVKTLHPHIHGGILANRDLDSHNTQLEQYAIGAIDLVCVNLYPFEEVVASGAPYPEAIENIDIGGVALIRAAAKNYNNVLVLTSPKDYFLCADYISQVNLQANADKCNENRYRLSLAHCAFQHTAYYDSLISQYLNQKLMADIEADAELKNVSIVEANNTQQSIKLFPERITIPAKLVEVLRYGENSHQHAAFYQDAKDNTGLLSSLVQFQGKALSYNNLADADTALECVKSFTQFACVIVKHANPCGVAVGLDLLDSYNKALSADPISSFGGIVAFNHTVDIELANLIVQRFFEVIVADSFSEGALKVFAQKPNLRVVQVKISGSSSKKFNPLEYKRVGGGILLQTPDSKSIDMSSQLNCVSIEQPSQDVINDLIFAWNVARFVKSNAIVLVSNGQTIGIGAGQMSRVDATKIAIAKAHEFGFELKNAICASDAFFPFRDCIDLLGEAGVCAIIQPGGSIKDGDVISACNEHLMAMCFTGYRIFRH